MIRIGSIFFILALSDGLPAQEPAAPKPKFPGPTAEGFLLPNGWHLTPAGKHIETSDLPLNIVPLKDNRHALVATDGFNSHRLYVVDTVDGKIVQETATRNSWFGLVLDKDESKIWWSGGGVGSIHTFDIKDGKTVLTSKPEGELAKLAKDELAKILGGEPSSKAFISGLAYDSANKTLYKLDINDGLLIAETAGVAAKKSAVIGGKPYDICIPAKSPLLYISDWAGRQVLVVDPANLKVAAKIAVGEHPNQIVSHPTDHRIFVACASSNTVSVIDTQRGTVIETISTTLFPKAPEGSTPCAVAVSPDGKSLYVANADNNCIAAIDIEDIGKSVVKGFIPTGWYPTAVAVTPDNKNLLIGVGKGLQSHANPRYTKEQMAAKEKDEVKDIARKLLPYPYIGTTMTGALSIVPVPDAKALKEYSAQVYRNCPYSDAQLTAAPHPVKTAIPTKVGDPSPIKYVVYIIKENRTYDQVFGDIKKGNGDPSLVMFGEKVTPNHHKLAEEFVLLDNLYCNGQVSADGHPWSTMAYHTDYIARDWHLTYSKRAGVKDDDDGDLANAPSGYLWDACKRTGISYRNYGEYGKRVSDGQGGVKMEARVPGLIGHICPDYGVNPRKKGNARDTDNAETFLKEYREFAKAGRMPKMIIMSLGEDHTNGTVATAFTPQACVASNDLALGRIVDEISHGPLWKETAIFVIEDDAQNGPDHVDAHRTVGLVISPYTKRKFLDSTQYATVSMIRTMELILGLPPLSQYDASARPMFESFTDRAELVPYNHAPAQIDLNVKNGSTAYGADRSAKMDFSDYDLVDDFELNEILWRAVKGRDAPVPPAVRRAIIFRSQK